jgi:serine/threonine-protein kinase
MTNLMFVIANEPHERLSAARPGLPPQLDAVIDQALCKQPAARYSSGGEMAAALRGVVLQTQ